MYSIVIMPYYLYCHIYIFVSPNRFESFPNKEKGKNILVNPDSFI